MYSYFNLGPYLHVTIFSLTILPFSAAHPLLCNRLCSAQSFPLHRSRLHGCHTAHKPWIYNHCYYKTWWTWRLLFLHWLLEKKSKFYVLKDGTKIALHIKGPGHEIYANFPDKIIYPDFVRSKFSFQVSACWLTQEYQMNCVVFKQPIDIPFSYYIPTY